MVEIIESPIGPSVYLTELFDEMKLDKSNYSKWIKYKIIDNPFAIDRKDYLITSPKQLVGKPRTEYFIHSDFAVKLCLSIKNNEKAESIKDYLLSKLRGEEKGLTLNHKQFLYLIKMVKVFSYYEYRNAARKKHSSEFIRMITSHDKIISEKRIYQEFNIMRNSILQIGDEVLNQRLREFCIINNRRIPNNPTKEEMMVLMGEYEEIKCAVWDLLMSMHRGKEFAINVGMLAQEIAKEIKPELQRWNETNLFNDKITNTLTQYLEHKDNIIGML
jgi:hypothetical protein